MFDYSKGQLMMAAGCDDYTMSLSRINLPSFCQYACMELLESTGWIVLGFVPTLAAMEAAWRIGKRWLGLAEAGVH